MTENESAKIVALQALTHILSEPRLRDGFLGEAGLTPADLEARIDDPDLLAGVLDFLLSNEAELMRFCEAADLDPMAPGKARAGLPGGALPHWT